MNNLEPGNNAMRVKTEHIKFLKRSIKKYLPDAAIYLIGSRADDGLKGGDIDILFFDVLHYVPEMKKIIKNVNEYYDQNLSQTHTEFFKEGRRSE